MLAFIHPCAACRATSKGCAGPGTGATSVCAGVARAYPDPSHHCNRPEILPALQRILVTLKTKLPPKRRAGVEGAALLVVKSFLRACAVSIRGRPGRPDRFLLLRTGPAVITQMFSMRNVARAVQVLALMRIASVEPAYSQSMVPPNDH